jgi:hypothetical protein
MTKKTIYFFIGIVFAGTFSQVCTPTGDEPVTVKLPVVTGNDEIIEVTNDEGWTVSLSEFQLAIENIEFTIEGETHASKETISDWLIPSACAHPGHSAGGDVVGELPGRALFDMQKPTSLGKASLLTAEYTGMNLHFRTADERDGLAADAPVLGHTAYLSGTATKGDVLIDFTALIDVEPDTEMIGGPFEAVIDADAEGTLSLEVFTRDPSEQDTLFDGLAFDTLDDDEDRAVAIAKGSAAHNILMKTLIRHDHYGVMFNEQQ